MSSNERISALMDHQLSDDTWLADLLKEPTQAQTWSRYHLIGDALRDELPAQVPLDFTDKVMAALTAEPTVLAPRASRLAWRQLQPKVVAMGRQLGQYAIAASVAAAVIVGVQQYQHGQNPAAPSPVLNTVPLAGLAAPVSVSYGPQAEALRSHQGQASLTEEQVQQYQQRVSAYLRDHQLQQRLHQTND
ncbi:RseA family anti-sigma factor [Pseudaeromonas sp. ZJS20]|uniref:sigma-E factor negative regulatory protein n=1 Tax=Pseudaeromonas aegiceratis TaxID=3153928 RepID=UPI00390C6847